MLTETLQAGEDPEADWEAGHGTGPCTTITRGLCHLSRGWLSPVQTESGERGGGSRVTAA